MHLGKEKVYFVKYKLIMYVPRSKTVFSRRDPLAGGALKDTPKY